MLVQLLDVSQGPCGGAELAVLLLQDLHQQRKCRSLFWDREAGK